jgi:hypothetical protein
MKVVAEIHHADLWPSAAAAYAAARDFMAGEAASGARQVRQLRPVPVAGRFALQVETTPTPHRVVGYLAAGE